MCKILIVEEDMPRRRLYAEELKRAGYQVIAVHRGEQALDVLGYMAIEVAVVNLLLSDGNGLDYVQEMVSRHHDLKVIACMANGQIKKEFRSWAVDYFLNDPADLTELKETVAEILQKPKASWRQNQVKLKSSKNSNRQAPAKDFRRRAYSNYLAGYHAAGGEPGGEMENWLQLRAQASSLVRRESPERFDAHERGYFQSAVSHSCRRGH
jgi:DNA-binding NtrC family response regulator